jgi:hypothetical protein
MHGLNALLQSAQEEGEKVAVRTKEKTENEKVKEQILKALSDLGGMVVGDDDLIFQGKQFILPANMEGNLAGAIRYLEQQREQAEEPFTFDRKFNYRPFDGANAFELAMRRMWGTTGIGKPIDMGFFGTIPPRYITINVSATETKQVPWGRVNFSPLEADFYVGAVGDREYGNVFYLKVEAPRKYRKHIEAFFMLVEQELREHSIYRGKAFTGAEEPVFIDTREIDPSRVVYSEDVMVQLEVNMWSLLRYTANMRKNGIPLKRAVLVEGPYGTGKTLAGRLTAKEAVENGWTFIQARPGKDDLTQVLGTAQLYSPAVVWYEDIDNVAHGDNYAPISALLDALDGITNKGTEVLAGFTTNFVDRIHKGVLRPGRLDAVIHIGELTPDLYELLVKVTIPENNLGAIDYEKVGEAFQGYVPAFATEAIARAMRYRMSRNGGEPGLIETEDLVNAANGLRPQLALQEAAKEGAKLPTMDAAFKELVTGKVTELVNTTQMVDTDGDIYYHLKVNGSTQDN